MRNSNWIEHRDREYDPVARRERYLRERQLKGRIPRRAPVPSRPRRRIPGRDSSSDTVTSSPATPRVSEAKTDSEKRREAHSAKIEELRNKLEKLKITLDRLVNEALGDATDYAPEPSSSKTSESSRTKSTQTESGSSRTRTRTASQKAADRKRSKEYYEKNKKSESSSQVDVLTKEIEKVQEEINRLRGRNSSDDAAPKPKPVSTKKAVTPKPEPVSTKKAVTPKPEPKPETPKKPQGPKRRKRKYYRPE